MDTLPPAPLHIESAPLDSWLTAPSNPGDGIGMTSVVDEFRLAGGEHYDRLPAQFRSFVADGELQSRVHSCTSCWINPADQVEAFDDGSVLVRFLSDQQYCAHWYVRLPPPNEDDRSHEIVWSRFPYGDESQPEADENGGWTVELREISCCAPTFEEFLWRFWLENELFYALTGGTPLTPAQQSYVDAIRAAT